MEAGPVARPTSHIYTDKSQSAFMGTHCQGNLTHTNHILQLSFSELTLP